MTSFSSAGVRPASYHDLIVWQRGMDLAVWIHRLTAAVPPRYRWGLALQMDRAAVSIPSNIAEGPGRNGRREFAHFASIAKGSAREVETQLLIGVRLGLFRKGDVVEPLDFADQVSRMLTRLIRSL